MATPAMHQRCITSTALGGLPRNCGLTQDRVVEPNPLTKRLVGRRIRLIGLLRKPLQMQGFYLYVHHRCITRFESSLGSRVEDEQPRLPDRMVEPKLRPFRLGSRRAERRLLTEDQAPQHVRSGLRAGVCETCEFEFILTLLGRAAFGRSESISNRPSHGVAACRPVCN
jgi:hypothetical protein